MLMCQPKSNHPISKLWGSVRFDVKAIWDQCFKKIYPFIFECFYYHCDIDFASLLELWLSGNVLQVLVYRNP